jgi:hypothetical protein
VKADKRAQKEKEVKEEQIRQVGNFSRFSLFAWLLETFFQLLFNVVEWAQGSRENARFIFVQALLTSN